MASVPSRATSTATSTAHPVEPTPSTSGTSPGPSAEPDPTARWPLADQPAAAATGEDPVPAEVAGVIELFATQLAAVAFPEIDAASLRRQADELRSEATAVARARAALEVALASLAARSAALGETAARAIAYARIYSQAHPDQVALASAIAALSASPAVAAPGAAAAPAKRRGRPPKRSAELFDAQSAPAEAQG